MTPAAAVDLTEILRTGLTVILTGAATYAAIRADLARCMERSTIALKRADDAHSRIDTLKS